MPAAQSGAAAKTGPYSATAPGAVTKRPEVIDDFLRNFFVKMGLSRTCEAFETEWYEMKATGRLEGNSHVPDVYLKNAVGCENFHFIASLYFPLGPHMPV